VLFFPFFCLFIVSNGHNFNYINPINISLLYQKRYLPSNKLFFYNPQFFLNFSTIKAIFSIFDFI